MSSQDPAVEIRILREKIDELNARKEELTRAWERESSGRSLIGVLTLKDASPAAKELQAVNRELEFFYGQRDAIIRDHPQLRNAAGAAPRKRANPTSHGPTQASRTAADRHLRKQLVHDGFKAWCAAQRPQIKASLENWEDPRVRKRFEADLAAAPDVRRNEMPNDTHAVPSPASALKPTDFRDFLREMEHPLAGWSDGRQEQLWVDDRELRELYALWREERDALKTETPA